MALDTAQVTVSLSDLQTMQNRIAELELEVADARKRVDEARLGDEGSDVQRLVAAFNHALPILQFAIANLHPLTVRGWPADDLLKLAALLPDLPGIDESIRETATDLKMHARDCASWEKSRAEGTEQQRLADENAAKGAFAVPTGA